MEISSNLPKNLSLPPTKVDDTTINGYPVEIWDMKRASAVAPFWPMYHVKFNPQGKSFVLPMAVQPIAWLELDRWKILRWMAESLWDAWLDQIKKDIHRDIDRKASQLFQPVYKRILETQLWLQFREAALVMKLESLEKPGITLNPIKWVPRNQNPPPPPPTQIEKTLLDMYDKAKNYNPS